MNQILVTRFFDTYPKTFPKKLKAVSPKSCREGDKEKERQLQSVKAQKQKARVATYQERCML